MVGMGALWLKLLLLAASIALAGAAVASGVTPQQCGLRSVQAWLAALPVADNAQAGVPLVCLTVSPRTRSVRPAPNEAVPVAGTVDSVASLQLSAAGAGSPLGCISARPASGRSPPPVRHT